MSASHVVRTTYREDEGREWWRYQNSRRLMRKRDKRFAFSPANLGPAYEYLKLLEEEVAAQYGLSPEIIVAAVLALEMAVVNFLSPDGTEAFFPERIAYLDKRGYLIVHDAAMDETILGPWSAEAHRRAFPGIPLPADADRFAHDFKRIAQTDSLTLGSVGKLVKRHVFARTAGNGVPQAAITLALSSPSPALP